MNLLKGLLWLVFAVAVIAVAVYLTNTFELSDRFADLFLNAQALLPVTLNFDQFLVALTIASLLLAVLVFLGCAGLVTVLSMRHQKTHGQVAVAQRAGEQLAQAHRRDQEQLVAIAQRLTKQFDKRAIVQTMVETASRMTSVPQANTAVALWLVNFETDTLRFERGLYCDETLFIKTEFEPTEAPFSRVISTQQPWLSPSLDRDMTLVKPEKFSRLASATSVLVVPLVIENSVLGVLVLFCHPDVLTGYPQRKPFYDTLWGELTLGLAIAVQGEVAILDRLTGAHNREYFMKRFVQEIERANRYHLPLSLLMLDIDNFKLVNDTLGHPQGDAVLKIIAKLIKKSVRAIDLVGRYGGEEFIIMLPETGYGEDPTSVTSGAPLVAERIRNAVDEEFRGLQKPLNLTISVGVASRRFPEDRESDYRDLVRHADEQLYRAKTTGKNKVCIYQPETPQGVV